MCVLELARFQSQPPNPVMLLVGQIVVVSLAHATDPFTYERAVIVTA